LLAPVVRRKGRERGKGTKQARREKEKEKERRIMSFY
jgi:hypothetical protein